MTHPQKLKSIRLCLSAHPDNEAGSEFEDRISDLDELIKAQEDADAALMDDFAKAVMQGMAANGTFGTYDNDEISAHRCYDIATALMNERERRMKG